MNFYVSLAALILFLGGHLAQAAPNPLKVPSSEALAEATKIIADMKQNPRGPYTSIRWHCADGSQLPPRPFACKDHGGGKQYAVYSPERARLAELGWPVGTIYTAISFDRTAESRAEKTALSRTEQTAVSVAEKAAVSVAEKAALSDEITALNATKKATGFDDFFSQGQRQQRLRELPLEQYMIDIDDGWVLHKARNYRGRVQIEDEEAAGRELLLTLLAMPNWLRGNYLLVRELVRVIPHGNGSDTTRVVRRSAQDIAEQAPSFENIRIEIHTTPSAKSADRVRAWLNSNSSLKGERASEIKAQAAELAQQIEELYGQAGREQRLSDLVKRLAKTSAFAPLVELLKPSFQDEPPAAAIARFSQALSSIREQLSQPLSPAQRLNLLDGLSDIEAELRLRSAKYLELDGLTRQDLLQLAAYLSDATYGAGLLTPGERHEINNALNGLLDTKKTPLARYLQATQKINASGSWAVTSVRYHFAEALTKYSALDPRAASFVDDVLRGAIILQLAETGRRLGLDAQAASGLSKQLFGKPAPAMMALNPGLARGRLRILSEQDLQQDVVLNRDDIVVLPQTVSELAPVAGVLTLGEGNVLSHVQLLARNFGIPNVTLTPEIAEDLQAYQGQDVILAAASDGSVAMLASAQLSPALAALISENDAPASKLDVPPVKLSVAQALPLEGIRKALSGTVVGPKAANLGELNALFPGRVAPALALPFGVFIEHVNSAAASHWEQLPALYQRLRAGEISNSELNQALEKIRLAITQLSINPATAAHLERLMATQFGPSGTYGLFIRSDTNAEDLPGFTGAGLYETVPNMVGMEAQLAAIPRVWASVLGPRAIAWRADLLLNPENVYPSVLLMKSVPADKSGVLVTADLVNRGEGLTASVAWGVGGAVAGEAAETVVLLPNGDTQMVSEAKTAYQRKVPLSGGVDWAPAPDGPVLTDDEKQQLRRLAMEVAEKLEPAQDSDGEALPWDIEFGFVDGELTLFQIRPLIEHKVLKADRFLGLVQAEQKSGKKKVKRKINLLETLN